MLTRFPLTASQEAGMRLLLGTDENLFITGGPGTGKSYLISEYLKFMPEKIPVIASTGAAAILVGGRTFHSFFGLGIMQGGLHFVVDRAIRNGRLRKRIKDTKTLVIDEVSMLSREAVDTAECIARQVRDSDKPWGGIRIIAVGDFAQLPPISKNAEKEWCFLGNAWTRSQFKRVILNEVKRTDDAEFLEILEDIRWGRVTERVHAFLNDKLAGEAEIEKDVPHLFPRRAETDAFNKARLDEIKEPVIRLETEYGGDDRYVERLMRDAPVPAFLELKKGALVMLRVNDPKQRYVNGTVGRIEEVADGIMTIDLGHRTVEIEPFAFTVLDDEGEEAAYARNFPVNLAYASTIHKIQGTTLERLHVSLKQLWEPGQAYVALSRARSAKGITLMGWDVHSIRADAKVREFYEKENEEPVSVS